MIIVLVRQRNISVVKTIRIFPEIAKVWILVMHYLNINYINDIHCMIVNVLWFWNISFHVSTNSCLYDKNVILCISFLTGNTLILFETRTLKCQKPNLNWWLTRINIVKLVKIQLVNYSTMYPLNPRNAVTEKLTWTKKKAFYC